MREVEELTDEALKPEVEDEVLDLYVIAVSEPMAYGIYTDLLIGNLLAIFMELRLLLEVLAYCYMARFLPNIP